jgi:hypothetical protein
VIVVDDKFYQEELVPIFEHIQNEFSQTQIIFKQEFLTGRIDSVLNNRAEHAMSPSEEIFLKSFKLDTQQIHTQSFLRLIDSAVTNSVACAVA